MASVATMAGTDKDYRQDVVTIAGTGAMLAARLCNFETARSYLLREHMEFLDSRVRPLLRSMQGPWVDIIGYASHRGGEGYNQRLSEQRCQKVRDYLDALDDVNFQIVRGLGETQSGSDGEADNYGWWRAVGIYVYATRPPRAPADDGRSTEFKIRVLGGASASYYAQADDYTFEIVDTKHDVGATFLYYGFGGTIPLPPQIPSIPFSQVKAGPFTPFRTTAPVFLSDFDGAAELYQDPGIAYGWDSMGGTYRLVIESTSLYKAGVSVRPSIIPISGGFGLATPSAGSASFGLLKMRAPGSP